VIPLSKFWDNETLFELGLPALTTMFGMQLLRVLLSSFAWYLGDSLGINHPLLGVIAIGLFLVAFLAEPFRRAAGSRRSLIAVVGGIGLMRLVDQISPSPAIDLGAAAIGTILFTFYFPFYLTRTRVEGVGKTRKSGRGLLLGIAADTTINGALGTLDLSWQSGFLPLLFVGVLVGAQWWMLARKPFMPDEPMDASFIENLPLAAIPLFVFVMELIFQNIARATTLTGFAPSLAFGFIVLANAVGVVAALFSIIPDRSTMFAIVVGIIFLAILGSRPDPSPGTADLLYLFGNLLLFPFITVIFAELTVSPLHKGLWSSTIVNGIGWLVFILFVFLYYVSYDIRIPFANTILPFIAIAFIGLLLLSAIRRMPPLAAASDWTSATIAIAMLILPILLVINYKAPRGTTGNGLPIRVMSYNVHNGFNPNGRLDPEALAQAIREADPDVVGLQEVERGWMIDSNLDLLTYLSRRLQMPFVFGYTADSVWGNAILSRYPIKDWGNLPLPPRTLLIRRGFVWAHIDVGGDQVLVINTHYDDLDTDTEIRQEQSPEILKFWGQRPRTIFLGDLSARPEAREIALLRDGGLSDSFTLGGAGDGFTYSSLAPSRRIDYVWVSSDLTARDFIIPRGAASDHLGIAVTIGVK
jgi:endonuclease/exonuclease/phosphatase family metal-dependent hydrolase